MDLVEQWMIDLADKYKAKYQKNIIFDPEIMIDFVFDFSVEYQARKDWNWFFEHPESKEFERPFWIHDCNNAAQAWDFSMSESKEGYPAKTILTRINENSMLKSFEYE